MIFLVLKRKIFIGDVKIYKSLIKLKNNRFMVIYEKFDLYFQNFEADGNPIIDY